MEIERDRKNGSLFLSQKSHIQKVLQRFNMLDSRPVLRPIASHFKLSSSQSPQTEDERKCMQRVPYSSAVGSLMYVMVCSRPDLAYAISMVSRFMTNPGKQHWEVLKWVLRYLKRSQNVGLMYNGKASLSTKVEGFVDSDYAGSLDTRKSLIGYVFTMYGGAVNWKANLQLVVALSTTEAEYIVVTEAIKAAIWLKWIIKELEIEQDLIMVFCDNQSAICLAKHQVYHERTKHIYVRMHFVIDVIAEGSVVVQKIPTKDNPIDMITNPVPAAKFRHCLDLIGLLGGRSP